MNVTCWIGGSAYFKLWKTIQTAYTETEGIVSVAIEISEYEVHEHSSDVRWRYFELAIATKKRATDRRY
jgi:hypothetical protein